MAFTKRKTKTSESPAAPKRGVKRARSDAASDAESDVTLDYVDVAAEEGPSQSSAASTDASVTTTAPSSDSVVTDESAVPHIGGQAVATAVEQESDNNLANVSSPSGDGTSQVEAPPSGSTINHIGESSASMDTAVATAPTGDAGPLSSSATTSAVAFAVTPTPTIPQGTVIAIPMPPNPIPPFGPGALVHAADINFTPAELEYVPAYLMPRILSILNFADPGANRYAVGLIPPTADWGPSGDGSGRDKYLCFDEKPITVWMVGISTSVWLTPIEGTRVNIGYRLLTDRDRYVARQIQYTKCRPEGDPNKAGQTTYASKFLPTRGEHATTSFEDVYDATTLLESWSAMDKISPDRVRKTDVVLVECYVRRFKSRDPGSRYVWKTYGVTFELLRIAHLLPGPGPTDLVPEESSVSF